jgi:hypothetical protein
MWTLSNELDLNTFSGVTTVNIELANGLRHAWREYSGDDLPAKWLSAYHSFDDDDMPAALRDTLGTSVLHRSNAGKLYEEFVSFTFYTSFDDLVRRFRPDNPTKPTPEPTYTLMPSGVPTRSPTSTPSADYGEKTQMPTAKPTKKPSAKPTPLPTGIPTASPSSIPTILPTRSKSPTTVSPSAMPTPYPTYEAPRLIHPYLLMVGDGPYATMYGFNQSLMDDMTSRGTVVVITTTVMSNMTVNIGDYDCVGYEAMRPAPQTGSPSMAPTHLKTTVVNRTYDLSYCRQNRAVICVRNSSSSQRIPVANVSFMDLSYMFIGSGEHDVGYLSGEMTLHALEGVFPTSNPTPVPTLYPTPRPTMKPTKGKKKNPPKPTMSPTAPSAVPTQTPTISPADICDSQPLARRKYNLEPNRIHFVAVTGSYREYKRAQNFNERFVDKFGGPVDDRFPDFEWEETVRRGMNYDYEIDIIDEFGGKTQMPTTSPTPKPTAHYLPSTLLSDPFRGLYTTYFLISFIAFFVAVSVFIAGRWFYNWKEERDVGAWFM